MRLGRMQYMDQTGLYAMEEMLLNLKQKEVDVVFINLLPQPRYMMERIDIIPDIVSEDQIFKSFKECMSKIVNYFNAQNELTHEK
jgi:SulP family sulfate permease